MRLRCHRSARALGTWLACHWWRRDGKALAGRVRRCCREAAAPPGTPFLGNDPRGASRLPPIRDATTGRLTTAHDWRRHGSRSQAGGILVGATVAVSWLPYGEAPAGGAGRCCREVAPIRAPPLPGADPQGWPSRALRLATRRRSDRRPARHRSRRNPGRSLVGVRDDDGSCAT